MSIWTLFQVVFNLVVFVSSVSMWLRLRRPPQDDPRLSRGLQLLQTKITVLEDLSDRTDAQVKQLSGLLDHKTRVVQNKILEAEQQMVKIDHSMNKSLEVAEIFQDKIPHQEILERQRTIEYVRAARMAHSGLNVDEISRQVPLPREQIELIAKFNREELMFDEAQLPDWAKRPAALSDGAPAFALNRMDFVGGLEPRSGDFSNVDKIGQNFKQAVQQAQATAAQPTPGILDTKVGETLRSGMETMQPAVMSLKATAQTFKEKLVATAEDLLRAQQQNASLPQPTPVKKIAPTFTLGQQNDRGEAGQVKKVIFPRLDK